MARLALKRAYEAPDLDDGVRVLVDRLWPRGLARDGARVDHWLRNIALSDELRRWFGHASEHWPEFQARYHEELRTTYHEDLHLLRALAAGAGRVTLLFAARDVARNNAVALKTFLEQEQDGGQGSSEKMSAGHADAE